MRKHPRRKHPRFEDLSLKSLPESTREQLVYLVDERGYTVTHASILGLRLLYQSERRAEAHKVGSDEKVLS